MPTSHYLQISDIISFIVLTEPESILDIGVGFGKYGFLAREYLELWNGKGEYHLRHRKIHGIEVFKDYITPVHDYIYDRIHMGDAARLLPTLEERYDLILLIDILEHFDFEEGARVLKESQKRGKNILISVPNYMAPQQDSFGNPYETHRFQWKKHHFSHYPKKFVRNNIGGSLIVYLGENAAEVLKKWRMLKRKNALIPLKTASLLQSLGLSRLLAPFIERFG